MSLFAIQGGLYATPPLQKFISNEESAMDEYLFIELAKLQADRRRLEREQREQRSSSSSRIASKSNRRSSRAAASAVVCQCVEQAVMKTFIAVVASLLVNGGLLGGLAWSVHSSRLRRSAKC